MKVGGVVAEVSASDLDGIVQSVVGDSWGVLRARTSGDYVVEALIRSRSGRNNWEARFEFDPDSGDFTCYSPYTDSTRMRSFGIAVQEKYQAALAGEEAVPPADAESLVGVEDFSIDPLGDQPDLRPLVVTGVVLGAAGATFLAVKYGPQLWREKVKPAILQLKERVSKPAEPDAS